MTKKKRSTAAGSDLRRVDVHVIAPHEYEEAPELSEEMLAKGTWHMGGKPLRGRPRAAQPKKAVNLRLDSDVIDHFQAEGPGWQTRINAALRKAAKLPRRKAS
jgi:uncharacterized protein (DUF4415 family)